MPINNKKNKKGKKAAKKKDAIRKDATTSVGDLMEAADAAFQTQDAFQAIALYTQVASSLTPQQQDYLVVMEKRANAKLAMGDKDGALEDYQAALSALTSHHNNESDPQVLEQKGGLFLYSGQLSEGKDALQLYQQGIGCLQASVALREKIVTHHPPDMMTVDNGDKSDHSQELQDPSALLRETRKQLAAAYCSAAELFLTDLCFEENAEQECEALILQALRLTDSEGMPTVDALQAITNLRLSQKRGLEAVEHVLQLFDKYLKVGCEALASLVGLREAAKPEEACELRELEEVQGLPGFEFRCQTAKLLLECAAVLKEEGKVDDPRASQCGQAAVDVLGSLLAENDEVVEIWFLTGEAFMALDPPNKDMAAHYWEKAKEMLTSIQESLEQEILESTEEEAEDELQRQLDEVVCQLEDVTGKIADLGELSVEDMEE